MDSSPIFLVSACLLGINARYDGQCKSNKLCIDMLKKHHVVPICPEQLGGLSTPRVAADITGGDGDDVLAGNAKVITRDGCDVTSQFVLGAHQVLEIANMFTVEKVLLKSSSPSCGVAKRGVTSALLRNHGYSLQEF